MAPGTEVKPPRIKTGNALSATNVKENCTPRLVPHMMPATRATRPLVVHTITQICLSEMPTERAAWWSSATARSARPMRVLWKKIASTVTSRPATTAATRSNLLMVMKPSLIGPLGSPMSSGMHVPAP